MFNFWRWYNNWWWNFVYRFKEVYRDKIYIVWWRYYTTKVIVYFKQRYSDIKSWWWKKTHRLKYSKCEDLGQRLLHKSVWKGDREI